MAQMFDGPDSECKYLTQDTVMLSMPMSIPRLSITQTIIAEEEVEKEQDNGPITEQSEQVTDSPACGTT